MASKYSYKYDSANGLCSVIKTVSVSSNDTFDIVLFWTASLKDAEDAIEYMESIEC